MVRTENGTRLPATYRSGRFDEWKAKNRVSLPRIGEQENSTTAGRRPVGVAGHKFKHNKIVSPKQLDKLSLTYDRKVRQLKKKEETDGAPSRPEKLGRSRYGGKSYGRVKTELKSSEQIRKDRKNSERRKAKNARPSRGSKNGRR